MRWIRTRIRLGAWCALLALAIQFTLSFGHVHRDAFASFAQSRTHGAVAMASAPTAPSSPTGTSVDYCAICVVMNMAGSLVPTAAPALPMPALARQVRYQSIADAIPARSRRDFFQARAPPLPA
jgi:hypothetical protein